MIVIRSACKRLLHSDSATWPQSVQDGGTRFPTCRQPVRRRGPEQAEHPVMEQARRDAGQVDGIVVRTTVTFHAQTLERVDCRFRDTFQPAPRNDRKTSPNTVQWGALPAHSTSCAVRVSGELASGGRESSSLPTFFAHRFHAADAEHEFF